MGTLKERIKKAVQEDITIVPYNPDWPRLFEEEKNHLLSCLPNELIRRIEHFGSTAIPNLSAKPIVDVLVEVTSLEEAKKTIVPILKAQDYDYFWRTDFMPAYAWFIKRDAEGKRSHHIHMVEADSKLWERLYFRDYLREFSNEAKRYEELKQSLAKKYPNDRVMYTREKMEFIERLTQTAKDYYKQA